MKRGTRTVGANKCLRVKILNEIDINYDRDVINRVATQSFESFSICAKNCILEGYISGCPTNGVNCWVCNSPPD